MTFLPVPTYPPSTGGGTPAPSEAIFVDLTGDSYPLTYDASAITGIPSITFLLPDADVADTFEVTLPVVAGGPRVSLFAITTGQIGATSPPVVRGPVMSFVNSTGFITNPYAMPDDDGGQLYDVYGFSIGAPAWGVFRLPFNPVGAAAITYGAGTVADALAKMPTGGRATVAFTDLTAGAAVDVPVTFDRTLPDDTYTNVVWAIQATDATALGETVPMVAREKESTRAADGLTITVKNNGGSDATEDVELRVFVSY